MSREEADKAAEANLVVVDPPRLPNDGDIKKSDHRYGNGNV